MKESLKCLLFQKKLFLKLAVRAEWSVNVHMLQHMFATRCWRPLRFARWRLLVRQLLLQIMRGLVSRNNEDATSVDD